MLELPEPSDELREGRRRLESIKGYELIEDLSWDQPLKRWSFSFRLLGDYTATKWVPSITEWHCIVSDQYPFGTLEIYPDAKNGISVTFPHMLFNNPVAGRPWLSGNICVKTSFGNWGKQFFNSEPFQSSQRLHWSIRRCKTWLEAAAQNNLIEVGDPFELPHFPRQNFPIWAFNEDVNLYHEWNSNPATFGVVRSKRLDFNSNVIATIAYEAQKKEIIQYSWGQAITQSKGGELTGLWLHLPSIPIIEPWQIPITWSELFSVSKNLGVDIETLLAQHLVEKKLLHQLSYLSLSFPIPENFGGNSERLHWFTAQLPPIKDIRGFRENTSALYKAQMKLMFRDNTEIKWLQTENWAKDQITSRGAINKPLASMNIALIGAGAIGSSISELLMRLGCTHLTIIDSDNLSVGNFARHTLIIRDLPHYKAQQLAKRLNLVFPFSNVAYINESIEVCLRKDSNILNTFDLIIDATANDPVLVMLESAIRAHHGIFVSLSTSIEAKKLYCYMIRIGQVELSKTFYHLMEPWQERESKEMPNPVFPLEGVGCWHPVFPARLDDIWSILSPTIRQIEKFIQSDKSATLIVIERDDEGAVTIINNN